jgi:carboxypeptidase Q
MRCWSLILARTPALIVATVAWPAAPASAQTLPSADPVIRRMWTQGMDSSQLYPLAQALLDSIGPRLTGSPGHRAGNDWLVARYRSWGITARNERYGSWRGWRRGITHVDLVAPRVRSLEGTMLAWSPGTRGVVEAKAVVLPNVANAAALEAWLPQARGRFVLISAAQPTCRPDANWQEFALPESFDRMRRERELADTAWARRLANTGLTARELPRRLEQAGAVGVLSSAWSGGWGVTRISRARTEQVPSLDLSCEDYGLVFRLAERGQSPVLRVTAEAEFLGDVPVFNTVAELRGSERENEYVMLSAHFDSWDGSSGATDNGSGTVTMLEAMRILKAVYPRPKRTILVGQWGGEEQGLNGSRAFAADNPQVVRGLHALFNQDNGTGRVTTISMQGLTGAGAHFGRWFAQLPTEIARHITLNIPGAPGGGGSDHAAFVCHGAPGFSLSSLSWDYGPYTWHTNRDTFDKLVFDDLRNNATLVAMLAYLAAEDPQLMARDQRVLPVSAQTGQAARWPACTPPSRSWEEGSR